MGVACNKLPVALLLATLACGPSTSAPPDGGRDGQPPGADGGGGTGDGGGIGCEPPYRACGTRCINTQNNANHCGACNEPCSGGAFCQDGECVRSCTGALTGCGSSCVDTDVDPEHCGECGNECVDGRVCAGGECVCADGTAECGGACVDTNNDAAHCGGCDNPCGGTEVCSMGSCSPTRETDCTDGADEDGDDLVDCEDDDCAGATRSCTGVCGAGVETCLAGGTWGACEGGDGGEEICGDGIDQDCDGADLRNPDFYDPNEVCSECPFVSESPDPHVQVTLRFDSVDDDVDCFKFEAVDNFSVSGSEHIIIKLENIPEGHDYDVYLYRDLEGCESRDAIGSSLSWGNEDERIDWVEERGWSADDSGTYYVRAVRFSGHSCTEGYDLTVNGLN